MSPSAALPTFRGLSRIGRYLEVSLPLTFLEDRNDGIEIGVSPQRIDRRLRFRRQFMANVVKHPAQILGMIRDHVVRYLQQAIMNARFAANDPLQRASGAFGYYRITSTYKDCLSAKWW